MVFTDRCRQTISDAHVNVLGFVIMAMDNYKREQQRKQQREGLSNTYIAVTHLMVIKPLIATSHFKESRGDYYGHKPLITYKNH